MVLSSVAALISARGVPGNCLSSPATLSCRRDLTCLGMGETYDHELENTRLADSDEGDRGSGMIVISVPGLL